ncbi:hypothetical protein [Nesterenkonia flava]|uniref:Uncharacterized protein n=1 Tax=Nesterenkonia flava TaxID=469799 RepID=A0ABU1FRN3_9MICC|nr:hypothetical protein [Nesterenkonia flava]MDR5710831.1 hypothetical protein [Nesterenkonia flava]
MSSDNSGQPHGTYDGNGQWQPGFFDDSGTWHGGFYDEAGQWQPGFYDPQGQWHAGYFGEDGTWYGGFRDPQGRWHATATAPAAAPDESTQALSAPETSGPGEARQGESQTSALSAESASPTDADGLAVSEESPVQQGHGTSADHATTAIPPLSAVTPTEAQHSPTEPTSLSGAATPGGAADHTGTRDAGTPPEAQYGAIQTEPQQYAGYAQGQTQHYGSAPSATSAPYAGHGFAAGHYGGSQGYPGSEAPESKKKRSTLGLVATWLLVLILLGGLAFGGWWFLWNEDTRVANPFQASSAAAEEEPEDEGQTSEDEEDASEDEEPDAVQAESGLFLDAVSDADLVGLAEETSDSAEVVTPLGTFTVENFATAEQILVEGQEQTPADGEAFRVVEWSFEPGSREEEPPSGSAFVSAAGETHELTSLSYNDAGSGRFLVSAADDDVIVIDAHGVEQQITLSTGERVPSLPAAGFYRDSSDMFLDLGTDFSVSSQNISVGSSSATISADATLNDVELTYYENLTNDPQGWASEGTVWAVAHVDLELTGDQSAFEFLSGSWQVNVTDQDGQTYSATYVSQAGGEWGWPMGYFYVAVEVPMDVDELEITLDLESTFAPWSGSGREGVSLSSDPITVQFPHELSD